MNLYAKIVSLVVSMSMLALVFVGCASAQQEDGLIVVSVSEVTRSVFYAPQYVALTLGFFEDEGLQIDLITSDGADRVMTSVLTGAADIGLSGPEAAIYVYNEGRQDFAVVFAQLTQRDGSFLLARNPHPDFEWGDLYGAHILPGRRGGVPYMALSYVVRAAGLTPGVDVEFDSSVQFAAMTGAFLSGVGDFVTVFEPTASTIELEGRGYIVASVGAAAGEIPFTAYYALESFIKQNPDIIQGFTNALTRGQLWVAAHSPEEIAEVISPFFPEADPYIMARAIANYKQIDAFAPTPIMGEEGFYRLQRVMEQAGELSAEVPFGRLVDNSHALQAVESLG